MGARGNFWQPRFELERPARYRFASTVREAVKGKRLPTWGAAFCERPPAYHKQGPAHYWRHVWDKPDVDATALDAPDDNIGTWPKHFATVNGRYLRIYKTKVGSKPNCVTQFKFGPDEDLYCCTWVFNADGKGAWWVLCAGKGRVVWVIDPIQAKRVGELVAHGLAIQDMKVHPRDPALIITASEDESIRMWNLRTCGQVAIFQGLKGHHASVLGVDFDRTGDRFVSCSIDYSIRIWDVTREKGVVDAIIESHDAVASGTLDNKYYYQTEAGDRKRCAIEHVHIPAFVTRAVHSHYVDCVKFVGDALMSKSLHSQVFLWIPGADRAALSSKSNDYTLLQEYRVPGSDVWYVRFALHTRQGIMAVGSKQGRVTVFNLREYTPKPQTLSPLNVTGTNNECYVRQCTFSDDAQILVTVDDAANVVQYERIKDQPRQRSKSNVASKPNNRDLGRKKVTTSRDGDHLSSTASDDNDTPMPRRIRSIHDSDNDSDPEDTPTPEPVPVPVTMRGERNKHSGVAIANNTRVSTAPESAANLSTADEISPREQTASNSNGNGNNQRRAPVVIDLLDSDSDESMPPAPAPAPARVAVPSNYASGNDTTVTAGENGDRNGGVGLGAFSNLEPTRYVNAVTCRPNGLGSSTNANPTSNNETANYTSTANGPPNHSSHLISDDESSSSEDDVICLD